MIKLAVVLSTLISISSFAGVTEACTNEDRSYLITFEAPSYRNNYADRIVRVRQGRSFVNFEALSMQRFNVSEEECRHDSVATECMSEYEADISLRINNQIVNLEDLHCTVLTWARYRN